MNDPMTTNPTPNSPMGEGGGQMTPEQCVMVCPQCEGEGGYPDGPDEAACHTICTRCESNGWIVDVHSYNYASARIKGDKDRVPVERPHEPAYDHTQDGTVNFERAMSYARSFEAQADLSNSAYTAFMAERGNHLNMLTELAHQYLSDLRYPPAPDSKERRIERIEAVLKQVLP